MAFLGATTLQIAFILALVAVGTAAWFMRARDLRYYVVSQRSLMAASGLVILATLALLQQLVIGNYNLAYVARYSSTTTPGLYKIASRHLININSAGNWLSK